MLLQVEKGKLEAGCDEAGRGCLAGPVTAAAVILPIGFSSRGLNDSKKISEKRRYELREIIKKESVAYAVAFVGQDKIDAINILNAAILAMHRALIKLKICPKHIAVDGNRFKPYKNIPYQTIVKGDSKYMNIAAASVLAKTYRDDFMVRMHEKYPNYSWLTNKGYPTPKHRKAIEKYGITPFHRKTFKLFNRQLKLDLQ